MRKYVLRLDGNEAYKRAVAIANLAGTWNSDFDFEVLDVKKD
jgi:Ca2+-dependent lipid-binding protein